jgi:hypothetical protein
MRNGTTAENARRPMGRHSAAALAAAIVSVALHVATLLGLSGAHVGWPMPGAASRKAVRALRVEDVHRIPGDPAGAAEAGEGMNAWLDDLAAEPALEGLPIDELATAPEPIVPDASARAPTAEPGAAASPDAWQPRSDTLEIRERVAADARAVFERRVLARPEAPAAAKDVAAAVVAAPGVASPAAWTPERAFATGDAAAGLPFASAGPTMPAGAGAAPAEAPAEPAPELIETVADETAGEITPLKPLENFLAVRLAVYATRRDPDYRYFRMEIERAGAEILPALPRDVLFVQDCSNSMAEQRLYFCRLGLAACLETLGPRDRFNIMAFREQADWCFPEWAPVSPGALAEAREFIKLLRPYGNTDIISSIREVLDPPREPGRPVIAVVVTDGRPTTGLTASTEIIGTFSGLNNGAVSVYTMGTVQTANRYLLDLLSYCNRGETHLVTRGRWAIPEEMQGMHAELRRPVLTDVGFRFAAPEACEVYPTQTANLYLDRPLVLYGRAARGTARIVCQAVGASGPTPCDMVFDLDLDAGDQVDDAALRSDWAAQKLYHLIGEYTRTRDPRTRDAIQATATRYRLDVPYRHHL